MAVLFEKTKLLTDKQFHYCPGCNHGIIHRLVAEVIDEMNLDGKVIGVDVDQSFESETVMTSALKGLSNATSWAIGKFYAGEWDEIGNVATSLGANDDAVGLPTETWSLESYTIEEYEALLASIKDGTVTIDSSVLEADAIVNAGLENVEIIYE